MDANITVMFVIKKTNKNVSSYLFDDKILGWAAKENSKKRFKSNQDLWTLQSTHSWANKKINKNKENKDINSKTLIDLFFKLTPIKKTKVLFSLNHGWKYSSNPNSLNIKSYWIIVLISVLDLELFLMRLLLIPILMKYQKIH